MRFNGPMDPGRYTQLPTAQAFSSLHQKYYFVLNDVVKFYRQGMEKDLGIGVPF